MKLLLIIFTILVSLCCSGCSLTVTLRKENPKTGDNRKTVPVMYDRWGHHGEMLLL